MISVTLLRIYWKILTSEEVRDIERMVTELRSGCQEAVTQEKKELFRREKHHDQRPHCVKKDGSVKMWGKKETSVWTLKSFFIERSHSPTKSLINASFSALINSSKIDFLGWCFS